MNLTKSYIRLGTLVFMVFILLCSDSRGLSWPQRTFSLRKLADINKDADIVAKAKIIDGDEVYENGHLVARWLPVIDGALANVKKNTFILKRQTEGVNLEVLVLLNKEDVITKNVKAMGLIDKNDRVSVMLDFDDETKLQVSAQSKNNIGCNMAAILDGSVYMIQKIESEVLTPILIEGNFTLAWLERFYQTNNTDTNVNATLPDRPGKPKFNYSLQGILLALVILIIIWRLLVFVIRFVQKGKISMVTFGLCSLGGISGAILLGYRKCYTYNGSCSEIHYSISILWAIVGALLGILVMYIIYRLLLLWEKRVNNSRTKENQE